MRPQKSIFGDIDWILVLLYFVMVFLGWLNIYAAVYNEDHQSILDLEMRYGKQLLWIGLSTALALIIMITDSKFFSTFSYPIYGIMILLLISALFFGVEVKGARAWFQIGSFRLQPAEFAKFATNLAVAKYLSTLGVKMEDLKTKVRLFILFGIPAALVILQNDTGSALVYAAFILVMFREGLSGNILLLGVAVAILGIASILVATKWIIVLVLLGLAIVTVIFIQKKLRNILIVLALFVSSTAFVYSVDYFMNDILNDYQRKRVLVVFNPDSDPKGIGYNVNQSKIAIGSGGWDGKGYLQGTQTKYNFVPEQSTDFIFCTVGEEWGFLGTSVVVILFVTLLLRLIHVAERQRSSFARIYGYGVACIFFIHFAINIGMTIGLVPVIGIPLPFFSYGGSSLWSFTILLFIFIKMDSYRMQVL